MNRSLEILALKLAQAEMNHAILQSRLERTEHELQETRARLEELEAETASKTEAKNGIIE